MMIALVRFFVFAAMWLSAAYVFGEWLQWPGHWMMVVGMITGDVAWHCGKLIERAFR